MISRILALALALTPIASAQPWHPPTVTNKLPNGLVVIVSEDHSAPTIGICVTYGIGFRLEPEGRTGFAHLFEHMMFEGTPNAPKGVFDEVGNRAEDSSMATRVTTTPNTSKVPLAPPSIPCSGSKPTA